LSFTKIKSEKRLLSSFGNFNSCEYPDISYTVSLSLLCVCVCVCVCRQGPRQTTPHYDGVVLIFKRVLVEWLFGPTESPCVCVCFWRKWRTNWIEYEFQPRSYEQKRRISQHTATV